MEEILEGGRGPPRAVAPLEEEEEEEGNYVRINLRRTVCVSAQNFQTTNHCHIFSLH